MVTKNRTRDEKIEAIINNLLEVERKSKTYLLPASASDWAQTKNKELLYYNLLGIEAVMSSMDFPDDDNMKKIYSEIVKRAGIYNPEASHEFREQFPLYSTNDNYPLTNIMIMHGKALLIAKAEKLGAEVVTDFKMNQIRKSSYDDGIIYFSGTAVVEKKGIESVLKE